ncbi:MAG: PIN domain-containing protein [Candidatus Micrarchaeota archaeon]
MELIVDANIVVAAILKDGLTRNLLFNSNLYLYGPENLSLEIMEHETEFISKLGVGKAEFDNLTSALLNNLEILPLAYFEKKKKEALEFVPDRNDWPYFAVALLKGCAVWSNDKRLKEQKKIKVISTEELYSQLSKREWLQ